MRRLDVGLATGGLTVVPDHGFADAPPPDVLRVRGGFGTRALLAHEPTLDWIRRTATRARFVTSACTGSLLLAAAGLLGGRRATTHWCALDRLSAIDTSIRVEPGRRYVGDGVIASAGVAAGIACRWAWWSDCTAAKSPTIPPTTWIIPGGTNE